MKRYLFAVGFLIVFLSATNAQMQDTVKYFKYGGFTVLSFNQVSLTNWSAGGENALSTTAIVNLFGNYRKDKVAWDNTLDLGYGFLKNGKSKLRKNEDKIELNSKFGYKAFGKVFYTALVNYRSQFTEGYNYPNDSVSVSQFMAPGYLSISLGMDYKPTDYFSVYLSPATGKFTFVSSQKLADLGAYGVEPAVIESGVVVKKGKKVRPEFGASLSTRIQKDLTKSINLASKLALFNNYTDKVKENRKKVDVVWEVMVNIKAGKYLTTSIMTNLIYDWNVIDKIQFKEVFGIGLSYKF
jgi:hypothetical protein